MLKIQLQRALDFDDDNDEVAELIERFEQELRAEYERDLAAAQALAQSRLEQVQRLQATVSAKMVSLEGANEKLQRAEYQRDAAQAQIRELTASLDTMTRKMQRCSDERGAAQARVGELEEQYLDMASLSLKHEHLADAARAEASALREALDQIAELSCKTEESPWTWKDLATKHVAIAQRALAAATPEPAPEEHRCDLCGDWHSAGSRSARQEPAPDARDAVLLTGTAGHWWGVATLARHAVFAWRTESRSVPTLLNGALESLAIAVDEWQRMIDASIASDEAAAAAPSDRPMAQS